MEQAGQRQKGLAEPVAFILSTRGRLPYLLTVILVPSLSPSGSWLAAARHTSGYLGIKAKPSVTVSPATTLTSWLLLTNPLALALTVCVPAGTSEMV